MDGKLSPELTQILNAIKEGGYGKDELVRRLHALVDRELLQNDRPADMELVNACQDILYRLHHGGNTYSSNRTEAFAKAKAKRHNPWYAINRFPSFVRVAAVLIIMCTSVLLYDVLISGERLEGNSTPDEQQYIVSGNVVDGVTQTGNAATERKPGVTSTTDLAEAAKAFGYLPTLPTWLPDGWNVHDYLVLISNHTSTFQVQYRHEMHSMILRLSIVEYENIESAQTVLEQNEHGYSVDLAGTKVYITENIDSIVAMWLSDNVCHTFAGPISVDELLRITESTLQEVT